MRQNGTLRDHGRSVHVVGVVLAQTVPVNRCDLAGPQPILDVDHDRVILANLYGRARQHAVDHLNRASEAVRRDTLLAPTVGAVAARASETGAAQRGVGLQCEVVFAQPGLVVDVRTVSNARVVLVVL